MFKDQISINRQYLEILRTFYRLRQISIKANTSLSNNSFANRACTSFNESQAIPANLVFSQIGRNLPCSFANFAQLIKVAQPSKPDCAVPGYLTGKFFTNHVYTIVLRDWMITSKNWNFCYVAVVVNSNLKKFKKQMALLVKQISNLSSVPVKLSKLLSQNYGPFTVCLSLISASNLPKLVLMPLETNDTFKMFNNLVSTVNNDKTTLKPILLGHDFELSKDDLIDLSNPRQPISDQDLIKAQEIYQQALQKLLTIKHVALSVLMSAGFNYAIDLTPSNVLLLNKMIDNHVLSDFKKDDFEIPGLTKLKEKEPERLNYLAQFV